jgi:hypothetical protein
LEAWSNMYKLLFRQSRLTEADIRAYADGLTAH